jgi:hypothetical protein
LAAQPSGTPRLLIEMRVLVAVYGSVGGSPSGHGTVVRFEGGVIDAATEIVRVGGC